MLRAPLTTTLEPADAYEELIREALGRHLSVLTYADRQALRDGRYADVLPRLRWCAKWVLRGSFVVVPMFGFGLALSLGRVFLVLSSDSPSNLLEPLVGAVYHFGALLVAVGWATRRRTRLLDSCLLVEDLLHRRERAG